MSGLIIVIIIIITRTIIITSIFKEDNVFSTISNLPYGPLMNSDNDYYWTYLWIFAMLVYKCDICLRRREASAHFIISMFVSSRQK